MKYKLNLESQEINIINFYKIFLLIFLKVSPARNQLTTGLREHSHLKLLSAYLEIERGIILQSTKINFSSPEIKSSLYILGELWIVMNELIT